MSAPIIIIDSANLLHRAFHGYPVEMSEDQFPCNAIRGFLVVVSRFRRDFPGSRIVAVFEGGVDAYRRQLVPGYKASRSKLDPNLRLQFDIAYLLPYLGVASIRPSEGEADDAIFTLARKYEAEGENVLIYSSDKDLLQCVTDRTHVLRPDRNAPPWRRFGPAEVEAEFGVRPNQIAEYLALVGDSADEIKGVANIGPKSAVALFQKFDTAQAIVEYGKQHSDNSAAAKVALNAADVERFMKVTTLRTVSVPVPKWSAPNPAVGKRDLESLGLKDLAAKLF